jgi:hypothetical protein
MGLMGLSSPFRRILHVFSTACRQLFQPFPGAQDHLFLRMRSLVREEDAQGAAQGLEDGDPLGMDLSLVYYWLPSGKR